MLLVLGTVATLAIDSREAARVVVEGALALAAGAAGVALGKRLSLDALVVPLTLAAAATTALLWTGLGWSHQGALRLVDVGILIQPSALWILACHFAAAAVASGHRERLPWLVVGLIGSTVSALAMPELSLAPQVAAGLSVVAWRSGHRKLALVPIGAALVAIALSPLLPYAQRRWTGFLDPEAHRLGAGYEYRALRAVVAGSGWFGPAGGSMPRLSSPSDDYWLASAMWQLGRIPVVAWVVGLVGTLLRAERRRRDRSPRSLAASAIVAGLLVALVIHAGYNLGLFPITATSIPLGGPNGFVTAVSFFGLGFALTDRASPIAFAWTRQAKG